MTHGKYVDIYKNIIVNKFSTGKVKIAIQPMRNEWNSERCQKRSFSFTFSNCINFIHFGTYTFYALFILSIICNGLICSGIIHYGIMYNVGHWRHIWHMRQDGSCHYSHFKFSFVDISKPTTDKVYLFLTQGRT